MTKRLPDYFVKLHDEIRKDTHCGWSDSEKESLIKILTPNTEGFPLFDMKVVPVQVGGTTSALEMALRFKYNGDNNESSLTTVELDTTEEVAQKDGFSDGGGLNWS